MYLLLFFMILLDFGKELSILLILYKTKSYIKKKKENILIYEISYKTSAGAKLLCIRFDKVGGFIKLHDKVRYLVLFDYSYCDKLCDKFKCLISEKSGSTDSIDHNFVRIRNDSYNSLPIENILL